MKTQFVFIEEEDREAFSGVLPEELKLTGNRVAVGAVDEEGTVLGAASYVLVDDQYNLDWIYVEPDIRRQGVGIALLDYILFLTERAGEGLPVQALYEWTPEDTELHSFFLSEEKMITEYSHDRYVLTEEDMTGIGEKLADRDPEIKSVPFSTLPAKIREELLAMLSANGEFVIGNKKEWNASLIPELSRVVIKKEVPVAVLFVRRMPGDSMELSYLYSRSPKCLNALLWDVVKEVTGHFPSGGISFDVMEEAAARLAERFFPNAKKRAVYLAEY